MRHSNAAAARDRLKLAIKDAERRGDMREALRLMGELSRLK